MATGIVTNVSANPLLLPDGSTLGPGETLEGFDEKSIKDDLFFKGGWLIVGTPAKQLQTQLRSTEADVALLEVKVQELQDALTAETLRANEAVAALATATAPPAPDA